MKQVVLLVVSLLLCQVTAHSFSLHVAARRFRGGRLSSSSLEEPSASPQSSWSDTLELGPPDAILGLAQAFRACTAAHKVNLVIGAYRDASGSPWILPTVRAAEARLLEQQQQADKQQVNKEYLPIEGDVDFIQKAVQFAYGSEIVNTVDIAAVQTLSGTGACRIGGEFLRLALPPTTAIYIPTPTWANHWKIFDHCGFTTKPYRYYDAATNALDLDGLLQDLRAAPDRSVVLLHACAHNPTGCDPTRDQWRQIAQVLKEKQHVAFLDSAYQGFASGDAENDAWALRFLVREHPEIPLLLAQSFAKNFGLYGERCGTLSVVCRGNNKQEKEIVLSQLKGIIRPMYSSPPRHGSDIVKTILGDPQLTAQYHEECRSMAERIQSMRHALVEELQKAGSTLDWSHVAQQIGMFAFTGMSPEMCDRLMSPAHDIYLTRDGRVSLAGLNGDNVAYVARAIHAVTSDDGSKRPMAAAATAEEER